MGGRNSKKSFNEWDLIKFSNVTGFASACTAGLLLPLKYTIGIRLSPEEELRGLDCSAHGEKWEITNKSRQATTSTVTSGNTSERLPFSDKNGSTSDKRSSRSRSNNKRRSVVRLRSDISRSRYNATRVRPQQQSQPQRNNQQLNVKDLPLPV
ncbi:unnamed protein product [Adineta steineri]|uniref:Uncharacterized protein n=1 Tax=Adineta steineri TaxID=433720 RepID=A0A813N6I2_9BILA|nr:unnamed protein product [Adineta steineri]